MPQKLGPRSAALLTTLARVPRIVLIIGIVAVFLGGAFAPSPVGPALLVGIAGLVAWLAWLGWSVSTPGARLARVLAIVALLAFAIGRL